MKPYIRRINRYLIPKLGYHRLMPTVGTETNSVVLVMDRSDEDVKLIRSLLEKTGFHVILSANTAEILSLCRAPQGAVQLVIIDTATPGLGMPEFLEQVQNTDPRIRILLISNSKDAQIKNWSATGNIRAHLTRPFRRAQFLGSVLEAAKEPLVRTA